MLALWINRGLEALWLLTVILVPLAFLDRGYAVSEAVIAYVEVPKVALLRTLVGLMAILWLIEWIVQGRRPPDSPSESEGFWLRYTALASRLAGWLRDRPSRWLILAVWFFLGTTLLSTLLSGSFEVSLWGEVPGQDGYSAYTIVAYVLLFAVIATHLRTRAQLWRILGAIVIMGTLVTGLALLQHYGHDFLNLAEPTGGGTTSTMGNKIFAAAVMVMTIPISLVAATITLLGPDNFTGSFRRKLRLYWPALLLSALWTLVLTVQLLGLSFTFSRGPWMGTLVGLVAFLGLVAVFVGWSTLGRATLLLGIASGATLSIVQWGVPISSIRLWLGIALALLALFSLLNILGWRTFGRACLALGVAATLAAGVILMPSWFDQGLETVDSQPSVSALVPSFGDSAVAQRFFSIGTYVSTGFFSGRGDTWLRSWELIRDRPWFQFDNLSLPWIRPLVGYGPDLFRYTYLLRSVPQGDNLPVEPDHAHNFFIHQTVEQGLFGLLSSVGLFMAAFLAGAYHLLWQRHSITLVHKIILVGVLATLAGRFLEMMVGLARVSDLTVLWVLLAIFVTLPVVFRSEEVQEVGRPRAQPRGGRRRNRRRLGVSLGRSSFGWPLFWRLAIVAWMVGGIGMLTWVKSINYVRAAVEIGDAAEEFRRGDPQASLASLDHGIDLAPDVASYYNYRSQVYFLYQLDDQITPERNCSVQRELPYNVCLAVAAFESNLEGIHQRPFYYRSHLAMANSAFNLKQDDEAIRLYREVASMVPNSVPLQHDVAVAFNQMAEAHLNDGEPEEAIRILEDTADFEMDVGNFAWALYIQGMAYDDLGQLEKSAQFMERSLGLVSEGEIAKAAHNKLTEVYTKLGWLQLAEEHRAQGQN